jgi:hypothetical protein
MAAEERRYAVELSNKLIEKNNKIGLLDSQNSLLQLKLRLALREIDLSNHTVKWFYLLLFLSNAFFPCIIRFLLTMIVRMLFPYLIVQINIVKPQNNLL